MLLYITLKSFYVPTPPPKIRHTHSSVPYFSFGRDGAWMNSATHVAEFTYRRAVSCLVRGSTSSSTKQHKALITVTECPFGHSVFFFWRSWSCGWRLRRRSQSSNNSSYVLLAKRRRLVLGQAHTSVPKSLCDLSSICPKKIKKNLICYVGVSYE